MGLMFVPTAEDRAKKLRAAGAAAASAVNWGCTPEDILAEVKARIAEALSLPSPRTAQPAPAATGRAHLTVAPTDADRRDFCDDMPTPAIDALTARLAELQNREQQRRAA